MSEAASLLATHPVRPLLDRVASRAECHVNGRETPPGGLVDSGRPAKASPGGPLWVARVRSGERVLDGVILVLLGAMLLPLVVGPFVAVYEFAINGQYPAAFFIGSLFGCLALVAIRAVRRGEFGPGVFFLGVGLLVGIALLGAVLSKWPDVLGRWW